MQTDDFDWLSLASAVKTKRAKTPTAPARQLTQAEVDALCPPAPHEGVQVIMPSMVLPQPFDTKLPDPDPNFYIADSQKTGFAYATPRVTLDPTCRYHGKQPGVSGTAICLGPLTNGRIRKYEVEGYYGITRQARAKVLLAERAAKKQAKKQNAQQTTQTLQRAAKVEQAFREWLEL